MKYVVFLILMSVCLVPAEAEQHLIAFATLKTGDKTISTPSSNLSHGLEAIRRTNFKTNNVKYTFALKSSAYEKDGKFHYSIGLSLSDTDKDDFIISEKGEMSVLKPLTFSFEKNGVAYSATVNLVSK